MFDETRGYPRYHSIFWHFLVDFSQLRWISHPIGLRCAERAQAAHSGAAERDRRERRERDQRRQQWQWPSRRPKADWMEFMLDLD
jgi:hypothetical protein